MLGSHAVAAHDSTAILALSHQDASLNLRRLLALCKVACTIPSRRPREADPDGMKLAGDAPRQGGGPVATRSASDTASWSTVSLDVRCPRGVTESCLQVPPKRGTALAGSGRECTPGERYP